MIIAMTKLLSRVTVRVLLASLMLMMSAMPTLAQIGKEPVEPAEPQSTWKAFLFAIVLGVGIAVGCLMSPKRTHQD